MSDYAKMSDEELDAAVAEKVMGWHLDGIMWMHADGSMLRMTGQFRPTSDMNAAMEVVQRVREMNLFSKRQAFFRELTRLVQEAANAPIAWPDAMFYLTPRMICEAALSASEKP